MLLRRAPANSASAEDAFLAAIAIAQQQGTRSFELRAALALAKLYQSTSRPAEAHAVLVPALEDFAPDSEMPEVGEGLALLAVLAETDEVRADASRRRQTTQLQVAYGNALIAARGLGALETAEAFSKARESATGRKDAPDRLAADYGLWGGSFIRGELSSMRAYAKDFLGDVDARPDSSERLQHCESHCGVNPPLRGRVRQGTLSSETRTRVVPTWPGRRLGLSLWVGRRRRRNGVPGVSFVASWRD